MNFSFQNGHRGDTAYGAHKVPEPEKARAVRAMADDQLRAALLAASEDRTDATELVQEAYDRWGDLTVDGVFWTTDEITIHRGEG